MYPVGREYDLGQDFKQNEVVTRFRFVKLITKDICDLISSHFSLYLNIDIGYRWCAIRNKDGQK